jgi:uncharacterized membrane protein
MKTIMDKYIAEFKSYLNQLNETELAEVVDFYSEYLQDGDFVTYEEAVKELGTPRQLARKVLADYSIRLLNAPGSGKKSIRSRVRESQSQVRTIWLIVLAILSTPLTIPIAIAVLAVLFAGVVAGGAVIFAIIAALVGILLGGGAALAVGIGILGTAFNTGLLYIGGGIAVIGAFLIGLPIINWLIRWMIRVTLMFSRWLYSKLSRKNRAEQAEERRDNQ